jgi:hypothetical protein
MLVVLQSSMSGMGSGGRYIDGRHCDVVTQRNWYYRRLARLSFVMSLVAPVSRRRSRWERAAVYPLMLLRAAGATLAPIAEGDLAFAGGLSA